MITLSPINASFIP